MRAPASHRPHVLIEAAASLISLPHRASRKLFQRCLRLDQVGEVKPSANRAYASRRRLRASASSAAYTCPWHCSRRTGLMAARSSQAARLAVDAGFDESPSISPVEVDQDVAQFPGKLLEDRARTYRRDRFSRPQAAGRCLDPEHG